jgi:Rapamycin-insensitive companion of mTOR, N-term
MKREIYPKFRKMLLLRERDRSLRESCIRALKKILKISKQIAPIMKAEKIHIVIGFFLEREFKSTTVAKERY